VQVFAVDCLTRWEALGDETSGGDAAEGLARKGCLGMGCGRRDPEHPCVPIMSMQPFPFPHRALATAGACAAVYVGPPSPPL
jgi:hypothetical protein